VAFAKRALIEREVGHVVALRGRLQERRRIDRRAARFERLRDAFFGRERGLGRDAHALDVLRRVDDGDLALRRHRDANLGVEHRHVLHHLLELEVGDAEVLVEIVDRQLQVADVARSQAESLPILRQVCTGDRLWRSDRRTRQEALVIRDRLRYAIVVDINPDAVGMGNRNGSLELLDFPGALDGRRLVGTKYVDAVQDERLRITPGVEVRQADHGVLEGNRSGFGCFVFDTHGFRVRRHYERRNGQQQTETDVQELAHCISPRNRMKSF
jgi:hypothetical protein